MKKAITSVVAFAVLGMMLLMSAPPASATTPVLTTFEIPWTAFPYVSCEDKNTNAGPYDWGLRICTFEIVEPFQGDWNGLYTGTGRVVFVIGHKSSWHVDGTFEGSVLGRSGTVDLSFEEMGKEMPHEPYTLDHAVDHFGHGTGGLAGISGHGRADFDPNIGTYIVEFWVHFE